MVQRISPEEYFSDNTKNITETEQPNNIYNYYYTTEATQQPIISEGFIYLGIFITGLFIGYFMAKYGS